MVELKEYRRRKDSGVVHWMSNCIYYPQEGYQDLENISGYIYCKFCIGLEAEEKKKAARQHK